MVSTGVWTIAGFLSALAVILIATDSTSTDLVAIGPDTLLRGLVAAMVGGMVSFPIAFVAAIAIGILEQVLIFNFPAQTGLHPVHPLRGGGPPGGAGEPQAPSPTRPGSGSPPGSGPCPSACEQIWWVRRLPQLGAVLALLAAVALPARCSRESSQQFTYAEILAFALCATSVTVLTGWAGQLSLGQMAFAGIGALSAAAFVRGVSVDIGWGDFHLLKGTLPASPSAWRLLAGAVVACLLAALVGVGALRVRGLLLAASTLAFAIAAQDTSSRCNFFSLGQETVQLPRGNIGPFDVSVNNRGYYYGTLIVLAVVLVLLGRLRRSGIGRTIIGVRENENAAAALTVSPIKAKLTAYAVSGLHRRPGRRHPGRPGRDHRLHRALLHRRGLAGPGGHGRDRRPRRAGPARSSAPCGSIGLPAFWPNNNLVPLLTSSIGLLIILLYIPGGFTQIGYWFRDEALRFVEKRLPPRAAEGVGRAALLARRRAVRGGATATTNDDGSVLRTVGLTVAFAGLVAVDDVNLRAMPGEVVGLIGTERRRQVDAAQRHRRLRPVARPGRAARPRRQPAQGPPDGPDWAWGAPSRPPPSSPSSPSAKSSSWPSRHGQPTSFWGTLLYLPRVDPRSSGSGHAEAAELIDFLGLGRYADRFVAELSTGTRRIVELAALLAAAPSVICLDEPTAGVAQREAEAFGPLIKRVQAELDATLVIVEHDLPLILAISDRVYCLEAGAVIAEGHAGPRSGPTPLVIASYLGTDERAIARSSTVAEPTS